MESLEIVEISIVHYGDTALSLNLEEGSGNSAIREGGTLASWCFFPWEYNKGFTLEGTNYASQSKTKRVKKKLALARVSKLSEL